MILLRVAYGGAGLIVLVSVRFSGMAGPEAYANVRVRSSESALKSRAAIRVRCCKCSQVCQIRQSFAFMGRSGVCV